MKCENCDEKLSLSEIILCVKCTQMAEEIIKEEKQNTGEEPFGSSENFNELMKSFVINVAEYQAKHRLDFSSTMAIVSVFITVAKNGNKEYMILYGKTLRESGVDSDGNDLL